MVSTMTNLERSKIGTLRTPHICIVTLRGRLKKLKQGLMFVAADAKGVVYSSAQGTTFHRMLDTGYLELIGTYTKDCPEADMWDDLQEVAKECGIRG